MINGLCSPGMFEKLGLHTDRQQFVSTELSMPVQLEKNRITAVGRERRGE